MAAKPMRGLGRGFDALIPTELDAQVSAAVGAPASVESMRQVNPADIDPNPHQPRRHFDETELRGLADSIQTHGLVHPPVVSQTADGRYQLIAGERRVRAARLTALTEIPVIVRSYDEQQKLELALLENVQRTQLSPLETAVAYKKLADEFNLTLDQIGQRMGKAKSTVANAIRLLQLPSAAHQALMDGQISEAHARAILSVQGADSQKELLENILDKHWTVRHAEEFARGHRETPAEGDGATGPKQKRSGRPSGPPKTSQNNVTRRLSDYLGAGVAIQPAPTGGKLVIEYASDQDLDRIALAIIPPPDPHELING